MEVEDREKRDRESNMTVEENPVIPVSDFGEGCGKEKCSCCEGTQPENYVPVTDTLGEKAFLNVEIEIEGGVESEEGEDDTAEETMVGV